MTPAAAEALAAVRSEACGCRACPLWQDTTQTVFGEGPVPAALMLVGEQPGDREDLAGRVFVGPAGRVLDEAFERAGVQRAEVYLTNAVKHFKHEDRGKRRLHKKPGVAEILACRPWLERELALVQPAVVVACGATAVRSLLGPKVSVTASRGQACHSDAGVLTVPTVHPSAILRADDGRDAMLDQLAADLRAAAALAHG